MSETASPGMNRMPASPSLLRAAVQIAGLAFASPSRADDWPTFRGNLFRNGATADAWLMRQVKDRMDPRRVFNPGRFVDGI